MLLYELSSDMKHLELVNLLKVPDISSTFIIDENSSISKIEYTIFGVSSMPPRVYEITFLQN